MSGLIPQPFIDDLVQRVDLVEIIHARVPLKKSGSSYVALCPFHQEKIPSFHVHPEKQFYYCFGCGAHGDALSFLSEYEHLPFPDAVEELARTVGIAVPRTGGNLPARNPAAQNNLYEWLEAAARYYQQVLTESPVGQIAREYLARRGLNQETIRQFRIGYAPPGWNNLLRSLTETPAREALIATGMIVRKEDSGNLYDRFRDRIMFPIEDRRRKIIAFGGRAIGDEMPKYLNSPETPLFHKARELYGLTQALAARRFPDYLLVVEGYMDVIALAQYGITQVVAILGSAFSTAHLEMLFKLTSRLIFCFDGDNAGQTAAWRALEISLPVLQGKREIRFLTLPQEEDPDTLIRNEGRDSFLKRVENATPIIEYLLERIQSQVESRRSDRSARIVELTRPLWEKLPPGIYQTILLEELANLARIKPEQLKKLMRVTRNVPRDSEIQDDKPLAKISPERSLIDMALGLVLMYPDLANLVTDPLRYLPAGGDLFAQVVTLFHSQPNLPVAALLDKFPIEQTHYLARLMEWTPIILTEKVNTELITKEDMTKQFRDTLNTIEQQIRDDEIKSLVDKVGITDLNTQEKGRLRELLSLKSSNLTARTTLKI